MPSFTTANSKNHSGESPLTVPPLDKQYLCGDIETAGFNGSAWRAKPKVFARLFQKAAVSKGGAFGRPPQRAKSLRQNDLLKG